MKVTLKDLQSMQLQRIVIESVDLSLYIAQADVRGERLLIVTADGKPLKTRNLLDMKSTLSSLRIVDLVLLQRSAYDEMVGQTHKPIDNALEIPLAPGFESLPSWQH